MVAGSKLTRVDTRYKVKDDVCSDVKVTWLKCLQTEQKRE